jgi:CheY-like chemotaxis protein
MEPEEMEANRVLIVDDSLPFRESLEIVLELEGFEVSSAGGGMEGLRVLTSQKFDAVLLDCRMPDIEGPEVCRRVRQGEGPNHSTPIIAMSISSKSRWEKKCEEAGTNAFIEKSGDIDSLIDTLRNHIR